MLDQGSARAACTTNPAALAWGPYWITRDAAGNCHFNITQYPCVASQPAGCPTCDAHFRQPIQTLTDPPGVGVLSGSPNTACEDLPGYDTAVANLKAQYYAPGTTGYGCDAVFTDVDQDNVATCLDKGWDGTNEVSTDGDPRLWVRTFGVPETNCDSVDNDQDGFVDGGNYNPLITPVNGNAFGCLTPPCSTPIVCPIDHKRLHQADLYQGDESAKVNLVEGDLQLHVVDAVLQGPYSQIAFARDYDSRRTTNDNNIGTGWTHSFGVKLTQMPTGDNRWQVQTPEGEMQYYRCSPYGAKVAMSCVIDDHHPQGNLIRTTGACVGPGVGYCFLWLPGDGSQYQFVDTATASLPFRPWNQLKDGAGHVIANATSDTLGRITQVATDNGSRSLNLIYNGSTVTIDINASSGKDIVQLSTGTFPGSDTIVLQNVYYADTVGHINTAIATAYSYQRWWTGGGGPVVLSTIQERPSATLINVGSFQYDSTVNTNRVTQVVDARKNLHSISYVPGKTTITFAVDSGLTETTDFYHNGLWVTSRSGAAFAGGMAAQNQVYDDFGRVLCAQGDPIPGQPNGAVTITTYKNRPPIEIDRYGTALASCSSPTTGLNPLKTWMSWGYNTDRQSWRLNWIHRASIYGSTNPDCSTTTYPSLSTNCAEVQYNYVSSSAPFNDQIRSIVTTGNAKLLDGSTAQQSKISKTQYWKTSDACWTGSGQDNYTGLPCLVQLQDGSGNTVAETDFAYAGTTGDLQSLRQWKAAGPVTLNTTFAGYNDFGAATSVTDPSGLVTTYAFNGWNAPTSITQTGALLDQSLPPNPINTQTSYIYNNARAIAQVTLPKGNKTNYIYYDEAADASNFGRLKAWATADSSGQSREIMRYVYDYFGNTTQERVLDAINSASPCYGYTSGPLEDCTTYSVYRRPPVPA